MKANDFLNRIQVQVPNMGEPGMTTEMKLTLLSQAVDEVNLEAKVYTGYTDINIVEEQQVYSISAVAPTYLGAVKIPVQFKDSDGNWHKVYPKTFPWLAKIYPDWLNADSADIPRWYWLEGDDLGFHNKPSTTRASGARIYHLKKATPMTTVDHYPFTGSAVELTALRPLDEAIIAWMRWQLTPAFGQNTDQDLREREFRLKCRRAAMKIKRRPDFTIDSAFGSL